MIGPFRVPRVNAPGTFLLNLVPRERCTSSVCFYSRVIGRFSETLLTSNNGKQWGANDAISDITPAAGWKIMSCNPLATKQDIELMCEGDDPNCGHLFQGGAVNTVVRLPSSVCLFSLLMNWIRNYSRLTDSNLVWTDAICTRGPALGRSKQFLVFGERCTQGPWNNA